MRMKMIMTMIMITTKKAHPIPYPVYVATSPQLLKVDLAQLQEQFSIKMFSRH